MPDASHHYTYRHPHFTQRSPSLMTTRSSSLLQRMLPEVQALFAAKASTPRPLRRSRRLLPTLASACRSSTPSVAANQEPKCRVSDRGTPAVTPLRCGA